MSLVILSRLPVFARLDVQAIHDPIETDDTWINGRSCEFISSENNSAGANDETDYDNRKIACGMVAQVKKATDTLAETIYKHDATPFAEP